MILVTAPIATEQKRNIGQQTEEKIGLSRFLVVSLYLDYIYI